MDLSRCLEREPWKPAHHTARGTLDPGPWTLDEHALCYLRASVIRGRRESQDTRHQFVEVHVLEGRHRHALAELGPRRDEETMHGTQSRIVSMLASHAPSGLPPFGALRPGRYRPAVCGDADHWRDARVGTEAQFLRYLLAFVDGQGRVSVLQGAISLVNRDRPRPHTEHR